MTPELTLVIVAFITLMGTIGSPVILSTLNGRRRDKERAEDYARQDLVAARAEKAATGAADAAKSAAKAATVLQESQSAIVDANRDQSDKLSVIHGLVNSSLTAAISGELNSTIRELALMKSIAGRNPDPDSKAAIDVTQARIDELQLTISDRNSNAAAVASGAAEAFPHQNHADLPAHIVITGTLDASPPQPPPEHPAAPPTVRSHHRKGG